MRRHGWRPYVDLVEVDTIEVVLEEDEPVDEFLALLHEIALEAIALRAHSPGDPRSEVQETPAPDEGTAAARIVRRFGRRRLVLVAALVVAALTAAIAPGVLEARRAAARLAALETSPGVLAPASGPPTELWHTPGRVVGDLPGALLVAGVHDGTLRRVDPSTGEAVWTVASQGSPPVRRCFPVDGSPGSDRARAVEGATSTPVACVAEAEPARSEADPPAARVLVLDPTTGAVNRTVEVPGSILVAEPLDEDLLVAARLADGRLAATRWDLAATVPRWQYTSPGPVLTDPGDGLTLRSEALSVGALAVDLTTGEQREAGDVRLQPISLEEHTLPSGARTTWWWYADGTLGQGRVTSDHGMRMFALLGPPLVPALTDGSQATTLVAVSGDGKGLRGHDLRTGRIRWSLPYPSAPSVRAALQVDGVMVLDDGAGVTAIDVYSGAALWQVAVDAQVSRDSAATDGHAVLLPERDTGGGLQLVARRIDDGAPLWHTALPPGTVSLSVVDRRLVAATGDEVVGLG